MRGGGGPAASRTFWESSETARDVLFFFWTFLLSLTARLLFGVCEKFQVAKRLGEIGARPLWEGRRSFPELVLTPPPPPRRPFLFRRASGFLVRPAFRG